MDVGLCLPQLGRGIDSQAIRAFCHEAEQQGFASLWVQEHLFYPHANTSGYAGRESPLVHGAYRSVLAATELLGFVAGCTTEPVIGTSVLVGGYHRPVELAQGLATLDVVSAGRLIVGLSVGWSAEEHHQMDVDPSTRGRRMDELVPALRACWGPDPVSFHGDFFAIPTSDLGPKPVQRPHPPLLSGMRSEAGMRRTARLFDIWNPTRGTAADLRAAMDQMAEWRPSDLAPLRLFFRSYTQRPTDTVGAAAGQGVDGVLRDLETARMAGAEHFIVDTSFEDGMDAPGRWADVPRRLATVLQAARD